MRSATARIDRLVGSAIRTARLGLFLCVIVFGVVCRRWFELMGLFFYSNVVVGVAGCGFAYAATFAYVAVLIDAEIAM